MNTKSPDLPFSLAPQIEADTWPVCTLPLCSVLLQKNAVWPWLILVPKQPDMVEIIDLTTPQSAQLWTEINTAARALKSTTRAEKLNIANLGNVVPQLHIHIIARSSNDPAWPGPVWGSSHTAAYPEAQRDQLIKAIRQELHPAFPSNLIED